MKKMQKVVVLSVFLFIIATMTAVLAKGEVSSEIIAGSALEGVVSLFEPKGSNNFIGTLEIVRTGSVSRIQRRNSAGVITNQSIALGGIGSVVPVYNDSGLIVGVNCFSGAGTQKNGIIGFNANLGSPVIKSSWPSSNPTNAVFYPDSVLTFSDGSYMAISHNASGIYLCKFNADDTVAAGWPEMKTVDTSKLADWTNPSIANIKATLLDDGNIIIAATARGAGNQSYDSVLFNVNGDGVNNVDPVRIDYNNLFSGDGVGGLEAFDGSIYLLGNSDGDFDVSYYLKLDSAFNIGNIFEFPEQGMMIGDSAIDPNGIMYFCGRTKSSPYDSVFGWINVSDPIQNEIFIQDFQVNPNEDFMSYLSTVALIPNGAIIGGSINFTDANRVVYTRDTVNPPVPEPATLVLLGIGLLGIAGIGRKKS